MTGQAAGGRRQSPASSLVWKLASRRRPETDTDTTDTDTERHRVDGRG
jgi:hypothetical protein